MQPNNKYNSMKSQAGILLFAFLLPMHDGIFTYPLTLKVRLPDAWTAVQATQGGTNVRNAFVIHNKHPYALIDAVPDKGKIRLQAK